MKRERQVQVGLRKCILALAVAVAATGYGQAPEEEGCAGERDGCIAGADAEQDACESRADRTRESDRQRCFARASMQLARGDPLGDIEDATSSCLEEASETHESSLGDCSSEHGWDVAACWGKYAACLVRKMIGAF